ncbi:MAG: 16S rRNA (cytosine(967)-C(5))-methyltransferase, partial [Cyanobacteria bacterium]|nr:16S rRNA (cytosine(967)-C(5))-methyltransferase [Cyanobacteriota bacterium]
PDARWRIPPDAIDGLLPLQQNLLEGLLPLLAEKGMLVYATCTFHPAENASQISAFLQRHSELVLQEQTQHWPDDPAGGDGFYTAVIQRR